jgi:transposase
VADCEEAEAGQEKSVEEIRSIVRPLEERKERYQGYEEELKERGESRKSLSDGDSRLLLTKGKMDVYYNVQTAVDGKHKPIAVCEVTNDGNDKNHLTPAAAEAGENMEVDGLAVVAGRGYDAESLRLMRRWGRVMIIRNRLYQPFFPYLFTKNNMGF